MLGNSFTFALKLEKESKSFPEAFFFRFGSNEHVCYTFKQYPVA